MIAIIAMLAAYFIGIRPLLVECDNSHHIDDTEELEKVQPVGPEFNADSAYAFVKAQCDFGPRAMNTDGHERCAQNSSNTNARSPLRKHNSEATMGLC